MALCITILNKYATSMKSPTRRSANLMSLRSLRWTICLVFISLAIPTAVLVAHAYGQLKWEAFHQLRQLTETVAQRIDSQYAAAFNIEESRSFAEYGFFVVGGESANAFLQPSPLSQLPSDSDLPGLIGHFQIDADGVFTSPLLPTDRQAATAYGVGATQREQRVELETRLRQILTDNRLLVSSAAQPSAVAAGNVSLLANAGASASGKDGVSSGNESNERRQDASQSAFDQLNTTQRRRAPSKALKTSKLGRVEELELGDSYQRNVAAPSEQVLSENVARAPKKRSVRKERGQLAESVPAQATLVPQTRRDKLRITTFESEIDPFELSLIGTSHFVVYRKVWRDGKRLIQGALLEREPFLQGIIENEFKSSLVYTTTQLAVGYQGDVFAGFRGQSNERYPLGRSVSSSDELRGELLYRAKLSAPMNEFELIFTVTSLPAGAGAKVLTWLTVVLVAVLCVGFFLLYRLGVRQIQLARQQQDFVSAVSHELKTPLTSIRMYGEILKQGWASDEKRKTYYDYIFNESERLSRLITNVLQWARMTRKELNPDLRQMSLDALNENVRSTIGSHIEQAGFRYKLTVEASAEGADVVVDQDFFAQILINLVDNAVKFSASGETKSVDIAWRVGPSDSIELSVRDYGPGVAKAQLNKIFELFYRGEHELTRQTTGTGIGLALVQQLAKSMSATVAATNHSKGAEFTVRFPRASTR